ncbi:Cytochrome P450 [Quillaja saponaria]|uniref:Cytochrome P450 n=1 Tax=Quillaja saponaria TaxID=32244 RepID=A0AAD7L9B5_QUISA|nr:Cytochrome P450 [Quillaja saponaria]
MDNIDSLLQTLQPLPMTLLFIIPLLLLLGLVSRIRRRPPYPPGPKGLPIIGNMFMMDKLTHRGLAELANQYGGIFHLRMGFLHMVAVSNPDVARQVLQVQDNIFSNRPATIAISYLTYDRADMAFAHYGPFWRQMRKLCVMKLFSRKRAESWDSVRDEVDTVVRFVTANNGTAVNIGELVFSLTKNIIYRAAFGTSSQEGQDEFISILQEFSKLFGAFNIADFIPHLGWVDPQGLNHRLAKARQSLDGFIDKIIDDHMQKKRNKKNNNVGVGGDELETDMVDELLAFYSDEAKVNESADLQNSIKLTKDNIKAIIMDVMFGGTETVASAIEWFMAELMKNPEELKRIQQELADVVGLDRRVEESDFEKLTYFKCAVKETLRLHPPIPLLLHETAEDSEVAGYSIPKKSRVMINAWAIGRDKDSWEDPDTFKPSRSCPGMQLGLYALELSAAHLLHCFTWELPDGMKPSELDMSDVFGLTAPRTSRLVAVPSKRVICPLV